MGGHILQVVWPIVDDTRTLSELIAEAGGELDRHADQAHAIITGPPAWEIHPAADVLGWTGYAPGSVLIARVPAEAYGTVKEHRHLGRVPDPAAVERLIAGDPPARVRQVDRRTAILTMHRRGADTDAIASRFNVTVGAVEQVIDRDRRRRRALVTA